MASPVIVMDGITLQWYSMPLIVPVVRRPVRIKVYYMKTGAGGAGTRCVKRLGTHISHADISSRVGLLPAQVSQLQAKALDGISWVWSINGTAYTVVCAEDGFKPDPAKLAGYDDLWPVDVVAHVLSQA